MASQNNKPRRRVANGSKPQNNHQARWAQAACAKTERGRFQFVVLAALIVLVTLAAYIPAMSGGFLWDDDENVTANTALSSLSGLGDIWFEVGALYQYYPLVFTTFWVENQLWPGSPFGFHLVNVLLHGATAVLLWLVLRRLHVPGAWLGAAVFALHPVHVESVAWITERKNVLSGLFFMAALLAYLRFERCDESPADGSRAWRYYPVALCLFVAALFSKTTTCLLPLAILLLLWWKIDRVRWRHVVPLVPMLIFGACMGLLTASLERHRAGAEGLEWSFTLAERCLIAGRAVWFYLGKLAWPTPLSFIYPRWEINAAVWWQYVYPVAAILVVVWLFVLRKRIGKAPIVAMLLFCGGLFPALGFFNVYFMRYSFVADHFQYLASIAVTTFCVALFTEVLVNGAATGKRGAAPLSVWGGTPPVGRFLAICLVVLLGARTWAQSSIFSDTETLWRNTLAKNPDAWIAHNNLGVLLTSEDRVDEAIEPTPKRTTTWPTCLLRRGGSMRRSSTTGVQSTWTLTCPKCTGIWVTL